MKTKEAEIDVIVEKIWRELLTHGESEKEKRYRKIFRMFNSNIKCKWCNLPFDHPASPLIHRVFRKKPSQFNPRFCNICDDFARKYQGGAEIEIAMVFADIRGSTSLAEKMSPTEFKKLIDRFYQVTTDILVKHDAMIDKLVGDEVAAFFMPGLSGPEYAQKAMQAAQEIMIQTGHTDSRGPWVPLGIGIHTGLAFVGAVGTSDGMVDITALGDSVNIAARLASSAKAGEILVSEKTLATAAMEADALEKRSLDLKGRSESLPVRVMNMTA